MGGEVSVDEYRKSVSALEEYTASLDTATDGKEYTFHHFAPGAYVREFFLPQGMYFTSKIHKTTHIFIVASGRALIVSDKGKEEVAGPAVFTTTPGTKRAVFGIEDTTFFTVHPTEETDLERLEDQLIAKDFTEIEGPNKELIK